MSPKSKIKGQERAKKLVGLQKQTVQISMKSSRGERTKYKERGREYE
jgi:hypothetical protein